MSDQTTLIEQAQFLLQRKIGQTHVMCALIGTYDVSAKVAEQACENAVYLLAVSRGE